MNLRHRFDNWIASWLDVICGLISILTLTYYRPWWDFGFRIWTSKRHLKKAIAYNQKRDEQLRGSQNE